MRAYVGPDGSAAEPSPDNVPYTPNKFLRAARNGAAEGDFCFLLGFPGTTMRYAPSPRLAYSDEVAVPQLIEDFGAKLALIATHATDRAAALRLASAKKGLANEQKRSLGKNVMMRKLRLLDERRAEESALIAAAPEAQSLLDRLGGVYSQLRRRAPLARALELLRGIYHGSTLLAAGHAVHEAACEALKPDAERETAYRSRNLPFLVKRLAKRLTDIHPPHEAALIRRAAGEAAKMQEGELGLRAADSSALLALADAIEADGAVPAPWAELASPDALERLLRGEVATPADDASVTAAAATYAAYCASRDEERALFSERDQLLAALLEVQRAHAPSGEVFYPDANGCLRLSAGHVEGYTAADAVAHSPLTTLAGLVDKHLEDSLAGSQAIDPITGQSDFAAPSRLVDACLADAAVAATPVRAPSGLDDAPPRRSPRPHPHPFSRRFSAACTACCRGSPRHALFPRPGVHLLLHRYGRRQLRLARAECGGRVRRHQL